MNTRGPFYCDGCGYDLRGGRPMGSCPECGQHYDLGTGMGVRPPEFDPETGRPPGVRLRTIVMALLTALAAGWQVFAQFGLPWIKAQPPRPFNGGMFLIVLVLARATCTSYVYERRRP